MTTTNRQPQLHIETGKHSDGTWWARVTMGQRPVAGSWRSVVARGFQTQQGASVEGVRSWFATAERVGWL
jgi:hypothetical protein